MKRILPLALGILFLIVVALVAAPFLMDWNKYKPQIIEQAKSSAGYDIKIDGNIGLSLLPLPELKIEGLTVAAPRGSSPNLLTMKQANVSINLLPLISGDIVIDTVRLVNPDIALEVLPDGSNSWMSDKLLADQNTAAQGGTGAAQGGSGDSKNISLDKLIIEDGRVTYNDRKAGSKKIVENINAKVGAKSLTGPFSADGSLVYDGKEIELKAETEKMENGKKEMPVDVSIRLPDAKAEASFKGVAAMEPIEIQGKMELKADNLAAVMGGGSGPLAQKLSFSGFVTANETAVKSEEIDASFGDAKGKGSFSLSNLKEQNPVQFAADMAFQGIINLDQMTKGLGDKNKEKSVEEKVAKGEALSKNSGGFIPETLSLPFPLEGTFKFTADGIQTNGTVYKGIVATITKTGGKIAADGKAMEIPGKTTANAKGSIVYATTSQSGKSGVTYADPSVTFTAAGNSQQLPTLLRAFAPDQDKNAAFEIYKTATFDLSGTVTPTTINLSQSTVKLDDTTLAVAGSYKPNGVGGKPDITIDLTTDTVDIDHIQSRMGGQKKEVVQKDTAAKVDAKKALEPVRNFEMPVNLTFDLSAQKAIYNAQQITGIRITGKASGDSLTLTNASAQDYMGAVASLKGSVASLKTLSGIDMSFYGKTSDVKALMQTFKVDASKIPQTISGAEANIAAKGTADALAFDAKVTALNGTLEAAGNAKGLLDKPTFSDLTIGAKHPNFVKAMQILNPAFSGGPGMERPFDFSAKAVNDNNVYTLSDLKANLGPTTLGGALKIDMTGDKPSVNGSVQAGNIPLDDLLGAKTGAANSGGGGGGSSSGGNAGGEKWSRAPLETGWMHSVNLDLALSAQSITYGGWNFQKPNTKIVLKDGNLNVDNLKAGLFGGDATLNARVQDPVDAKQPLSLAVQTKMANVNLEPLAYAMSGSNRIKAAGDVSLDMDVKSSGLSSYALVSGLNGKSTLNGKSIVMKGFDLAQIGLAFVDTGKPMDRLSSLMTGAVSGGETRFDTVDGVYDIAQGIATITSMQMDGPAANIKSKGNVNLPQWYIDTIHTITFKQAKEAGAFDVAIKGSLSNPGNTFGKGLFNDVLTRRLQSTVQEKLGEKIQDKLGEGLGGKLQDLGILPKKQPVTPTPTPAPTTPAPVAPTPTPAPAPTAPPPTLNPVPDASTQAPVLPDPATPAPAAQPDPAAQAPAQQLTPKEQKQQDTEKAIKGVLEGLMQ